MKVIVCFDNVRVTVPCGDGTIPVRELINKAVHRYTRAVGKGSNHWVEVTSLKTISGGGILDPDDQLVDVVDDKEQLIADFEEHDRPSVQHNGGDGASASSTGTTSPDMFQASNGANVPLHDLTNKPIGIHIDLANTSRALGLIRPSENSTGSNNVVTDVVVTSRDLTLGSNLRVRRGSEPNLNLLSSKSPPEKDEISSGDPRPFIPRRESVRESDEPRSESSDDDKKIKVTMHGSLDRKKASHSRFTRDALRTSLSNRPEMYHWLEAQENLEQLHKKIKVQERMGPVEGHDGEDVSDSFQTDGCLVCLQNDGGPLGIHAVPAFDEHGKEMGLLIQSIEPDRPVDKDGRIKPNDTIVEINGNSLKNVPFLSAQNIFRAAMDTKEIRLRIVKGSANSTSSLSHLKGKQKPAPLPPAILPKPRSHAPARPSPLTLPAPESKGKATIPTPAPRDASKKTVDSSENSENSNGSDHMNPDINSSVKVKPESLLVYKNVSPSPSANIIKPGPPIKAPKKVPPAIPARNPGTSLTTHLPEPPLNAVTNTRRIGKKLVVQLRKGPLGLGFSVTSRDNQTDGNCPIYIRNILPKGAAVQSGQLRPGDRLLEVNGVHMTGKTQAEAVSFLRMLPEGSLVELVLSRQEEVDEKFRIPRKLGDDTLPENEDENDIIDESDGAGQPNVSPLQPSQGHEVDTPALGASNEKLTLHIPLNDTGSAGLGVSVKGKTESSDSGIRDLGIFVKTVLKGGAAYKDGRLQVNDQLLEVNGVKLEGLSNTSAMEALRVAMMEEGQVPGVIKLTVARRTGSEPFPLFSGDSPDNSQMDIVPSAVHKRASSASNVSAIVHQRSSSASEVASLSQHKFGNSKDMPSPIPPMRSSRVAALREHFSDSGGGLRNESYMKAAHESFHELSSFINIMPSPLSKSKSQMEAKSLDSKNIWINESDTYTLPNKPQRPHSTIGFLHGHHNSHSSASDDEAFVRASVGSNKDENDLSPHGDLILPFEREGFGRQSMSEKRKGHLDPRSTEIYKLVKGNKENKGRFLGRRVQSFHVTGSSDAIAAKVPLPAPSHTDAMSPYKQFMTSSTNSMMHVSNDSAYQSNQVSTDMPVSNMKRASSLENIVNVVEAPSDHTHDLSPMWKSNRFGRARGCNESFRAAVDRSYDALDPALMDTLEEESAESGAFTFDPSHSSHSSVSSEATNEDMNSLKRIKAKEKEKKGLFKGFLRFGKGRKSDEEAMRRSRSEERPEDRVVDRRTDYSSERPVKDWWAAQPYGDTQKKWMVAADEQNQQQRGRKSSQQEQERIEEEYARLRDYHVGIQRLRSQSVDPSSGRNAAVVVSHERSSPFQPYPGSSAQWQHQLAQQQMDRSDPRSYHPAAMTRASQVTNHDYAGKNQSYSNSGGELDGKGSISKTAMSRAEYIQQLRSQYQQRHRQRQGVYPLDDREEQYEMWNHISSQYEPHIRDPEISRFYDRPSSRQSDQKLPEKYGSSFIPLNTNNSTSYYPGSHSLQHQKQHQHRYEPGNQSHPGSRPQSRTGPAATDVTLPYNQTLSSSYTDQIQQHHKQHHHPQQVQEFASKHFQDQYSSSDTNVPVDYHVYEPQPQHFYTNPAQMYHSTRSQYSHHRGGSYADSTSTKV
ncbi:unnamed protein product [Candidula unifasciata]|uniref:PDZ domain-containing protein n=1 Tax=Candidula unifasciata TaxID=100452 RepID=A0A8S3YF65_9EUPU|nr:unnamed protein product [Candidula unifasciata]